MMINNKEYIKHDVFSELQEYVDFYSSLSMSVMSFVTMGTTSLLNIDTYVYSSIQGTVDSIKILLKKGRINDAYSLLRKYHDSVIINIYSNLYLQDHHSLDNFVVEKINNWVRGKEKLPDYRVMSQYIKNNKKLDEINRVIGSDKRYQELRKRCNNNTHYNYYYNVMLNDGEIYLKDRLSSLDRLSQDIRDIFILHLGYMFFLNEHYMMSNDYIDYLDVGMEPPEGCQYLVAPFVQNVFDNVIYQHREDVASVIKENACMELTGNEILQ